MVSLFRHGWQRNAECRRCGARFTAVCRNVALVLLCANASTTTGQAQTLQSGHSREMPPGAIGHRQLLRGGPLREYIQPVRLKAPEGARIAAFDGGTPRLERYQSLIVGLQVGNVYRFRLTEITRLDGVHLYPSVEVIDRLYPPAGRLLEFPIPIDLNADDLRLAAEGKYVTRVIYVEEPDEAMPFTDDEEAEQRYFEVLPGDDPLVVAQGLGRPVAILRIGNRVPDKSGRNDEFSFNAPPVLHYDTVSNSPTWNGAPLTARRIFRPQRLTTTQGRLKQPVIWRASTAAK